jgi:prepilin-type processing-associated H-X9-DG protein/prepilin-type N-terminal cleavage/methylation domain-containing protein
MRVAKAEQKTKRSAFTLIELLVVLAITAFLSFIAFSAVRLASAESKRVACVAKLKSLCLGVLSYCAEHGGEFPRSFHSSGTHREPGWAVAIAPYLGVSAEDVENPARWERTFNDLYRSPVDKSRDPSIYSYALNVYFELHPEGDDYVGSPQTWRRVSQVPRPSRTLLFGQPRPVEFGDHLMCHQWSSLRAAANALNHAIHRGRANYAFVDGHVESLKITQVFDPLRAVNLWNPGIAR